MDKVINLTNIKRALNAVPSKSVKYTISGWIKNFRPYKSINFIDLIDGSSDQHLQVIVKKDLLKKPELGSYLSCEGDLIESSGQKQELEFRVDRIKYRSRCDPSSYPLATTTELPFNSIRKYAHFRPKTPNFAALLRVRSELELSIHMIMKQLDYFSVSTPTLTSNDSEASSDLFVVQRTKVGESAPETNPEHIKDAVGNSNEASDGQTDCDNKATSRLIREGYFNKDVFLVTSAQLHLESLAASLSRVYTISHSFRAENSISTRHLCEFLMFEAEEANLVELEALMDRVESVIKFSAQFLHQVSEHRTDFAKLIKLNSNEEIFDKLYKCPFIRMSYTDALEILRDKVKHAGDTSYGADIGNAEEKELLKYCDNIPIFITNYPKQLKPFYMKCDQNNKEAECFDLIAPHGGEICGGSLREESADRLLDNLKEHFVADDELSHFDWYLDTRRFGSYPHGGFGIGFDRLVQSLLGIRNIRDSTAFPRWPGNCPM